MSDYLLGGGRSELLLLVPCLFLSPRDERVFLSRFGGGKNWEGRVPMSDTGLGARSTSKWLQGGNLNEF